MYFEEYCEVWVKEWQKIPDQWKSRRKTWKNWESLERVRKSENSFQGQEQMGYLHAEMYPQEKANHVHHQQEKPDSCVGHASHKKSNMRTDACTKKEIRMTTSDSVQNTASERWSDFRKNPL
jgi:hypothetical protein